MATTLKVLGQSNPSATTNTDLYTVPASTSAVVSSISICNVGATNTTFRIAVIPNGDTISNENYIYYNVPISASETFVATIGITLATGDKITVYAENASLSFNAFGQENT